jgi:hypothetical protein
MTMNKEHFEILLEDIQGTNQLLLEGQVVLQNQLAQFKEEVDNRFCYVDEQFDSIKSALREIRKVYAKL